MRLYAIFAASVAALAAIAVAAVWWAPLQKWLPITGQRAPDPTTEEHSDQTTGSDGTESGLAVSTLAQTTDEKQHVEALPSDPKIMANTVGPSRGKATLEAPATDDEGPANYQRRSKEERQDVEQNLVASGPAPAGLYQQAEKVLTNWKAKSLPDLRDKVSLSPFECYRGGCVSKANYADFASYHKFSADFTESDEFTRWPGGRFRSGPEIDPHSGKVSSIWVLMSPDEQ